MAEQNTDDKLISTESSTVEDAKQTVEASSATTEGATKSPDVKEPTTLEEAIAQAAPKEVAESSTAPDKPKAEKKDSEGQTKDEKEPVEVESADDESADVPFSKHPRWQKLMGELQELRPLAERMRQFEEQRRGVTDDQLKAMLEIGSLMEVDPPKALEKLKPYIEALEAYQGLRLPPDLQKRLDDGVADEETVRETARLRAQLAAREKRQSVDTQQQAVLAVQNALQSWETNKRATEPGFVQRYDMVRDRFLRFFQSEKHDGSPQAILNLAIKADEAVKAEVNRLMPRAAPKAALSSKGSVTKVNDPETIEEAIAMAGTKYRE
jgi:hypothetical protein